MELLADRDPEEARKLLDPVLDCMTEAVHRFGGTVNSVMGDGIMALFGAPLAYEDHAVRACHAALRMQEMVKRHTEDIGRAQGANLRIRVGLNSGEVLVRTVSNDLNTEYTAIGRTVHIAARMEQLASPGCILLAPSTNRLVEGFVTTKSLGTTSIKGLGEALEVYEAIEAIPLRTRFRAVARRELTRFVGRDTELEQLSRLRQLAMDGFGQVVAVVADAGVGKSRLVYELAGSHREPEQLVLECGAVSYGKAMSYLPVINLLKSYFGISDRDDLKAREEKVVGKLNALAPASLSTLPALLALLDVPVNDAEWQALDPGRRRRQTLDAVTTLLLSEARKQPLLLIVEDLHWIDGETQALLDDLVECLDETPMMLLVTYRPEFQDGWSSKTYYKRIQLEALPTESAEEMLDALLGGDPALGQLKQLLVKLAKPFYLEEAVRTLVETKALEGLPGQYRLTRPVEVIEVPATVQVTLAARMDRLPSQEKNLLQVASAVGKDVPFAVLQAVTQLPDEVLRTRLDQLQAAEFIYPLSAFPTSDYTFKHALTHEVAYGGMPMDRRRSLHTQIVNAIELLHQDRLDEHIERLAYHSLHSELREKAVGYLRRAGQRADARSARQDAAAWLKLAIGVADSLPEIPTMLQTAFDIRLELRHMLVQLCDLTGGYECLREASTLAEKLNDDHRRGQVLAFLTNMHSMLGEMDKARETGNRALEIATRLGNLQLRLLTTSYLQQAYSFQGNHRQVVELVATNLAAIPAGREGEHFGAAIPMAVFDRCWLVRSLAELGRFSEASRHEAEMFRLIERRQHWFTIGQANYYATLVHILRSDWVSAHRQIERSIDAYRAGNVLLVLPQAIAHSAWCNAELGNLDEAGSRQHEAERLLQSHEDKSVFFPLEWAYRSLSHTALIRRQIDQARRFAHRALDFSKCDGEVAHALRLLGDIGIQDQRFDADESKVHYEKALALAETRDMRPLIAHCHFGLGRLHRRTENLDLARQHLVTATTMYREMDMHY
jgi:predicted ATPase/class 3 adenylate cyclase